VLVMTVRACCTVAAAAWKDASLLLRSSAAVKLGVNCGHSCKTVAHASRMVSRD
jgi:hypothetical protein